MDVCPAAEASLSFHFSTDPKFQVGNQVLTITQTYAIYSTDIV
jgi:hypothetical protein